MIVAAAATPSCTAETRLKRVNEVRAAHQVVSVFSTQRATSVHFGLEVLEINVVSILP